MGRLAGGAEMRIRNRIGEGDGFTLAEVLIAGVILAVALVPVTGMFDTAFKGIRTFENVEKSTSCAKQAMEQIQAIPFYLAHADDATKNEDWDIDDRFWGVRDPINDNPVPGDSVPSWGRIPEISYYDYGTFQGYEQFRVGVQLAYLEDSTAVAAMHSEWGPRVTGKDRPINSEGDTLHMLLVKVNVYWKVEDGKERSYSIENIVTDTQAIYNFGSSKITVDREPANPSSVLDPNKLNAAAHWSDPPVDIKVTIEGWGFDPDTVRAWLVRNKNVDIEINLTEKTPTVLKGTVNLYSTGTAIPNEPDWAPKAAVGYWTLKTRQEDLFSSYLYNGFIVEYPKPVISNFGNASDMSKTGMNNQTAVPMKVEGGPFVNLVEVPAVRLVKLDENGDIVDQVSGTVTSMTVPSNNGYVTSGCTINATFDLTQASAGEYRMCVVNTREPTYIGHRASDYSAEPYVVTEFRPVVSGITVDKTGGTVVYQNKGNPWAVTISGSDFNQVGTPPVEIYLCSDIVGNLPGGNYVKGTVTSSTSTTIKGTFDVSTLPLGNYIVCVKNLINGVAGWTSDAPLQVTMLTKYIDTFRPDSAYYPAFYENYYDVTSYIEGLGLSAATSITITNGTVTYPVDEYTINSNTKITVKANLINCPAGSNWEVRVYLSGGDYVSAPFSIELGPAKILPANDSKHAVKIYRAGIGFYDGWSVETTSAKAQAYASTTEINATARFEVLGMGFPISGTTTLRVWLGSSWSVQGNYTTTLDRATKTVKITSPDWIMPKETGTCGISVQRVGSAAVDSYPTRWDLVAP
jgi:hypothetical protein